MSLYGPIEVSGTAQAHLGDVHHHHYNVKYGDEWQECLRALLLVDPRESKDALKSRKGNRVNGTCEWFLSSDEFTLWLNSSLPCTKILWLYGNPGTGKSTLSIFLVEALEEDLSQRDDAVLAYFFCDSTSKYQNSAIAILRGLLFQLCMRCPAILAQILLPEFRTKGNKIFDSFTTLWRAFDAALNIINETLFIFIDALDECDQESQELLLQQLETYSSRARLFISSRPSSVIREVLAEFTCRDLASFKQIETDIDLFIAEKVSKLAVKKKYTPRLREEVTELLASRAEGTFLWVGLACAEMQRLPAKSGFDLLKSLPSGLNLIYNKLFERAIADAIEAEDDANNIIDILKFVAVAMVPLTVAQLSSACSLYQYEHESERDLFTRDKIEACRFMVVVEDKYIRLLHKSVKDFLFGSMTTHFPSLLGAHADLAHRCVAHLIQSFQDVQTPTFSMSYDEFYQYSARNWMHHARCAQQEYRVSADQDVFFRRISNSRDDWLSYLLATGEDIPPYFSVFDVAARWGITSLLQYATSKVANDLTLAQFQHDVEYGHGNPLISAAGCPYVHIFTYLLNLRAFEINGELHIIEYSGLLNRTATMYRLPVTVDVLAAACRNTLIGVQLVTILIAERSQEIILDDIVLQAIVSNESCGARILQILFKNGNPQISPSSDCVNQAVTQSTAELEILGLLPDHGMKNDHVSDNMIGSIIAFSDAENVQRLLREQLQVTRISTELTMKAIENRVHHNEVFLALLTHARRPVRILLSSMKLIAKYLDSRVFAKVTDVAEGCSMEMLLEYGAANQRYGVEVVTMMLNEEPGLNVSEAVLIAAAQNLRVGGEILRLLLEFSSGTKVTSAVMAAALDIGRMSETHCSYWMTMEVSPVADDIEDRVAILSSRFDHGLPFSEDVLYGLIYYDADYNLLLHSSTLHVVDILSRTHKIALPESPAHSFRRIGVHDDMLIAVQERSPIPCTETLLELVVRLFGVEAFNYVLDRLTSPVQSDVMSRLMRLTFKEKPANTSFPTSEASESTPTDYNLETASLCHPLSSHQGIVANLPNTLHWPAKSGSDDNDRHLQIMDPGSELDHIHVNTTALRCAIERNDFYSARNLLQAGANMYAIPGQGAVTMSKLIREKGRAATRLIEIMIEHGAKVNLEDTQHETPLVAAISQGLERIVTMLIRAGADVNAYSNGGNDCAMVVLASTQSFDHQSHYRVLQILLQNGAHMSLELHQKLVQRAVRVSNCEEIRLLARNLAWFASNGEVFPPLGSKDSEYSSDTICLLSRLGVELGSLMHWDEKLILMAIQEGRISVVSWLSSMSQDYICYSGIPTSDRTVREDQTILQKHDKQADLCVRNIRGETLIHLAAIEGQLEIMQWLLVKCKHDVMVLDLQDVYGRTALHTALQLRHYEIATALIKHGADLSISDGAGHDARDWITAAAASKRLGISMRSLEPSKLADIKQLQSLGEKTEVWRELFRSRKLGTNLYRAGRILHALGHHDEAARAHEESIECEAGFTRHRAIVCNHCGRQPIIGTRYICYLCDDCDFCEGCWEHRHFSIPPCCDQHTSDFLSIPRTNWKEIVARESTEEWLKRITWGFWMNKGQILPLVSADALTEEL